MKKNNIIPIHQIGFPISFGNIILDDDSVRMLYDVMEGLDYTELNKTYSTIGRNPALLPETMFAIIVYGYMEGIYSSRALEKVCKRDINFKWLLQGQEPPTHNSIDRFRRERLAQCIENLFNQFIKKLRELDEIQFKNIFIDGTKIEACANRYTFVWKKVTDKFEDKLQKKTKESLIKMNHDLNLGFIIPNKKITVQDAKYIFDVLYSSIKLNNIEFVYGKGKRKSKKSKSGYKSTVHVYECENCSGCEYKSKCTKAKGNKQLHVAKNFIRLRNNSLKNITTEKGILLRMNRSIQVEGAFGVIKEDYGYRRFLMRGTPKVRTEFLLMAFGYNVNKLHNKTLQKRNGELLHKQQAS